MPTINDLLFFFDGFQVKRMIGACGGSVKALHRFAIGNLTLDPTLDLGQAREMSLSELALLAQSFDDQVRTISRCARQRPLGRT
eukprot:m.37597 g.37597  ORF g.37597 m.37597 type:complete len:84 (-) comp11398_c0_seq2:214-465(-)